MMLTYFHVVVAVQDFSAITALPAVDFASMHIYTEYWPICTTCAPLLLACAAPVLMTNEELLLASSHGYAHVGV